MTAIVVIVELSNNEYMNNYISSKINKNANYHIGKILIKLITTSIVV